MGEWECLYEVDPEVAAAIKQEENRQRNNIELIASENFVSKAVLAAAGTVLTNKYAEGYPGKRYYGGCEFVDIIEALAIERAKTVFGAEHANVQPHAGANANLGVYYACLKPGDAVVGMDLAHGGHLTHGSPVNISGKYYRFHGYGVDKETGYIDYEQVARVVDQVKPKLVVAGASAYPRFIDFARFQAIAEAAGALLMVDMAHIAGLVAAGLHPSPVPYAEFVTTTTHKTLRGPRGGMILCRQEWAAKIDKAIFPGLQGGPLMHIIAAKAVGLQEVMRPEFITYQQQVLKNAATLARALKERGFDLVSGGTDNHLLLVDLRNKKITGKEAEYRLDEAGITVNKNAVPFDTEKAMVTSGIRIGTPAVTSRGMDEKAMEAVAIAIDHCLTNGSPAALAQARGIVAELCEQYPLYSERS